MDAAERQQFIDQRETELAATLESHILTLEELDRMTGFDFDIATDLQPELIDNSTEAGRQALHFWKGLYDTLREEPTYTLISKYAIGTKNGVCTGFGQPSQYVITDTYVRLFKGLKRDDIVFERDGSGVPRVVINRPSILAEYHQDKVVEQNREFRDEPAILMDRSMAGVWDVPTEGDQILTTRIFAGSDISELMFAASDATAPSQEDLFQYEYRIPTLLPVHGAFDAYIKSELFASVDR